MLRSPAKSRAIHTELREKITSGVLKEGDRLPTTTEIAEAFGCSVNMASKAITMLIHEGLVEQKRGLGSRVISNAAIKQGGSVDLNAFAFIYPSEQHDSIWRTLKGFQAAAQQADRPVVLLSAGSDFKKETEFVGRLAEFDVKGTVILPLLATPADAVHFSQLLINVKRPVVLTEISLPSLGLPTVIGDRFHASHAMTQHMLTRKTKRIGFFANYAHVPEVRDAYRGYLWALEEAGLEPPRNGVMLEPSMNANFDRPLDESTRLARTYLDTANELDAVVCANDYLAAGCITAATEANLSVPVQLKIASCDDYNVPAVHGISITSYRFPHHQIGIKTFEVLDALTKGQILTSHEICLRGEIIERTST